METPAQFSCRRVEGNIGHALGAKFSLNGSAKNDFHF